MAGTPLTLKQARFVQEYLKDLNATQAAVRAGYSAKTARPQGHRLLTIIAVSEAVSAGAAKRIAKGMVSADRILEEIGRLAVSDPRAMFDDTGGLKAPRDWSDEVAAAIAGIEVDIRASPEGTITRVAKVRRWDKLRALELLAKYHGLLKDRVEHTHTIDLKAETTEALKARALAIAKQCGAG